jgi:phage terminase large subunit GpA-like protein
MRIEKLALDTGYDASAVYSFARLFGDYQLLAPIKGESQSYSADQPVRGPTYQDVLQGGKKFRRGVKLWTVAGAFFKNELYRQFRLDRPTDEEVAEGGWPPGYVHLPGNLPAETVRQLVSERRILRSGKYIWEKVAGQSRNEALDCGIYARAAAWLMQIDRWTPARWRDREAALGLLDEPVERPQLLKSATRAVEPIAEPPRRSAPPAARNRTGGWLARDGGSWLRR